MSQRRVWHNGELSMSRRGVKHVTKEGMAHWEKKHMSQRGKRHVTKGGMSQREIEHIMPQREVEHVTKGSKACHKGGYGTKGRIMASRRRVEHVTQ